jgi:hypothetical protein
MCITSTSYLASLDDNSSFCKKVGEESNVLQGTVPNMLKKWKLEDTCSHIIGIHQSNQWYNLWRTAILHPIKLLKRWPTIAFEIFILETQKQTYMPICPEKHFHNLLLSLDTINKIKSIKYFLTGGSIYLPCRETSNSKYLLAWFIHQTVFSRMCFNTYCSQVFETKTIPRYI